MRVSLTDGRRGRGFPSARGDRGPEAPPVGMTASGPPHHRELASVNRGLSTISKLLCVKKQTLRRGAHNNHKAYAPYTTTVPHTISDHGSRRPLRADAGMGAWREWYDQKI